MSTIPPTTQRTIREALIPLIVAITPSSEESSDIGWQHTSGEEPRGDIRLFRILTDVGRKTDGGLFADDGVEFECELTVQVSYTGLDENEATDMITRDGADLWGVLHPTPAGLGQTIAGVISVTPIEPTGIGEDPDTSTLIVDFTTELHYKAALQ